MQKVGQETGDIIKFYNEVFVPSTKSFLLHMGSNAGPSVPSNIAVPEDKNQGEGAGQISVLYFTSDALVKRRCACWDGRRCVKFIVVLQITNSQFIFCFLNQWSFLQPRSLCAKVIASVPNVVFCL